MFTLVQSNAVNLDIAKVIRSLIKFIERRPFDMLIGGPIKFIGYYGGAMLFQIPI